MFIVDVKFDVSAQWIVIELHELFNVKLKAKV